MAKIGLQWRDFIAEVSLSVAVQREICFRVSPAAGGRKVDLGSLTGWYFGEIGAIGPAVRQGKLC